MKYLLLGSSGQLGKALSEFLLSIGEEIIEFDLIRSDAEDLRYPNNILLRSHLESCDFVIFLAFDIGGARYLKEVEDTFGFLNNNSLILSNTFQLLREFKTPFIFISSQMSSLVNSSYGLLKALGEKFTSSVNGLSVKLWNVYGYEDDFERSHVITDFIRQARANRRIEMITDGMEYRQFLYVRDFCECIYELSNKFETLDASKNFHITSFRWNQIIDVANMVAELVPGTEVISASNVDLVQNKNLNIPDPHILKYWRPTTDLVVGLKNIFSYYNNLKHQL